MKNLLWALCTLLSTLFSGVAPAQCQVARGHCGASRHDHDLKKTTLMEIF